MENGFWKGIATAVVVFLIIWGIKGIVGYIDDANTCHRNLVKAQDQIEKLERDTVQYRKDLRYYMKESGKEQWNIDRQFEEYARMR